MRDATGQPFCSGSPWEKWSNYWGSNCNYYGKTATTPEEKRLAHAEVEFLQSLLPKARKP